MLADHHLSSPDILPRSTIYHTIYICAMYFYTYLVGLFSYHPLPPFYFLTVFSKTGWFGKVKNKPKDLFQHPGAFLARPYCTIRLISCPFYYYYYYYYYYYFIVACLILRNIWITGPYVCWELSLVTFGNWSYQISFTHFAYACLLFCFGLCLPDYAPCFFYPVVPGSL